MAVPLRAPEKKCEGVVPTWMLAVAVGSAFLFFAIVLGLLMYHGRVDIPWWLACWCSRFSPWERGALAALENSARRRSSEEAVKASKASSSQGAAAKGGCAGEATCAAAASSGEALWNRSKTGDDLESPGASAEKADSVEASAAFGAKLFIRSDSAWLTSSRQASLSGLSPKPGELPRSSSLPRLEEEKDSQEETANGPSNAARRCSVESSLSEVAFAEASLRRSSSGRERDSWRTVSFSSRSLLKLNSVPVPRRASRCHLAEEQWPDDSSSEKAEASASPTRRAKSHTPQLSDGESGDSAESISPQQKRMARAALASLSRQQSKRHHYTERLKHGSSVRDPIMLAPFDQFPGDVQTPRREGFRSSRLIFHVQV